MPSLEITTGSRAGTRIDLGAGESHEVGSAPSAGVRLEDPGVEPEHARVLDTGGAFVVVDLGSQGGTRVNGEPLGPQTAHTLQVGDEIQVGPVCLKFVDLQAPPRVAPTVALGGPVTFEPSAELRPSGIRPTIAIGPPVAEDEGEEEEEDDEPPEIMRTMLVAPPPALVTPPAADSPSSAELPPRDVPELAVAPATGDPPTGRRGQTRRLRPLDDEAAAMSGGPTQVELEAALESVEAMVAAARQSCEHRVAQARRTVQAAQQRFHQAAQRQRQELQEAQAALRSVQEELARERADAEELREAMEELNGDLIAITEERDRLAAKLQGGGA